MVTVDSCVCSMDYAMASAGYLGAGKLMSANMSAFGVDWVIGAANDAIGWG